MLRITRLTDYGTVLLAHLAGNPRTVCSAAEVAAATRISLPTVSKILKSLAHTGLVISTRGANGGYQLARHPDEISAADIIDALEGPISITKCSASDHQCSLESNCSVGSAWQRINVAIRRALDEISLVELRRASSPVPRFRFSGLPITVEKET